MPPRRPLEETRILILKAGSEILAEDDIGFDLNAVNLIDACRRAGLRTAGSGYRIWPTQNDFRIDLMRFVATNRPLLTERLEWLAELLPAPQEHRSEHIRKSQPLLARGPTATLELRRQTALWLRAHRDPEVRAAYADSQHQVVEALAEAYERVLPLYDVEMRPPYTVAQMAFAVEAQTLGHALMSEFGDDVGARDIKRPTGADGELQDWDLLSCVVDAIAHAFTRPCASGGSHEDAE